MTPRTFYLTTPIYYVNARPHLGPRLHDDHGRRHVPVPPARGGPGLLPDRHRRARRQDRPGRGEGRRLAPGLCRRDRRGVPGYLAARSASPTTTSSAPPSRATRWSCRRSSRSSTTRARSTSASTAGNYCFGCERFYTDKEIVDGNCPDHQTPLTFIKEQNYFFRMSKYQDWLIKHLEEHPDFIQPERYRNEVLGFLREPLQDLSISRPKSAASVGHPAALRRPVRDLRLVRRPHQLRLGRRISGRPAVPRPVGGRSRGAPDRQGHPQAARRLLADHAEGRRDPALPSPQRARLLDARRREDVEVRGQRRRGVLAHRQVRPRRLPVLPAPGDEFRPRRELQRGGAGRAAQRRPRQ